VAGKNRSGRLHHQRDCAVQPDAPTPVNITIFRRPPMTAGGDFRKIMRQASSLQVLLQNRPRPGCTTSPADANVHRPVQDAVALEKTMARCAQSCAIAMMVACVFFRRGR